MEAFRLDEAAARAEAALALAASCRQARYEGRAAWIARAAAYRMGAATSPDRELCDLAAQAGVAELEAFVCLNEGAVAFREGDLALAADLATRAQRVWEALGKTHVALLARALAIASIGSVDPDEAASISSRALAGPLPTISLQIIGLLARAWPAHTPRPAWPIHALVAAVPARHQGTRMEVVSVDEAIALCAAS